jgi:hypothetical protein
VVPAAVQVIAMRAKLTRGALRVKLDIATGQ